MYAWGKESFVYTLSSVVLESIGLLYPIVQGCREMCKTQKSLLITPHKQLLLLLKVNGKFVLVLI